MLWKSGEAFLASAVFLGGRWALTANHAVLDGVNADFHVTLPIEFISDMRPSNSFRVANILSAPGGADLALISFAPGPSAPAAKAAVVASDLEIQQAGTVQMCGFGSDDCSNPTVAGTKRISSGLVLVQDPAAKHIQVDTGKEFAADDAGSAPATCPSDSGGGAFVSVSGQLKLAGIIRGTVRDPQNGAYTLCTRLSPLMAWIRQTTGLPV